MIYCGECGAQNSDGKKFCWKCGKALTSEPMSGNEPSIGQLGLPGQMQASLDRRLVAFLIDLLAMSCLVLVLSVLIPGDYSQVRFAVPLAYFTLLWGITGTSIGKDAMGLYIVKKDGTPINLMRALARAFVMLMFAVLWIAWWPALLRKDRRGLHDLASGTMVVRRQTRTSHVATLILVLVMLVAAGVSVLLYYPPIAQLVLGQVGPYTSGVPMPTGLPVSSILYPSATPTLVPPPTLASATSTRAVPSATPAPTDTTVPTPRTLASASPTSQWLFADDFVDNRNGWPSTSKMYLENGIYHVKETDQGYSRWARCNQCGPLADFAFEVMITKAEGPDDYGYGISFRSTSAGHYVLWITGDGGWKFESYTTQWNAITPWSQSDAIRRGNSTNKIRVIARSSSFEFFVNDQFLGSAVDTMFSSGYLGFGVGRIGQHITAQYVRVWTPAPVSVLPPAPTPTSTLDIPPGMGAVVVNNFCGFDVTITIGKEFRMIPPGGRETLTLAPGHYTVSATAPGHNLTCGGAGCGLDVVAGKYTLYPYCSRPAE